MKVKDIYKAMYALSANISFSDQPHLRCQNAEVGSMNQMEKLCTHNNSVVIGVAAHHGR